MRDSGAVLVPSAVLNYGDSYPKAPNYPVPLMPTITPEKAVTGVNPVTRRSGSAVASLADPSAGIQWLFALRRSLCSAFAALGTSCWQCRISSGMVARLFLGGGSWAARGGVFVRLKHTPNQRVVGKWRISRSNNPGNSRGYQEKLHR